MPQASIPTNKPDVQDSVNIWFPEDSGVREKIEAIHKKHPYGFVREVSTRRQHLRRETGTATMDLAFQDLRSSRLQRLIISEDGE